MHIFRKIYENPRRPSKIVRSTEFSNETDPDKGHYIKSKRIVKLGMQILDKNANPNNKDELLSYLSYRVKYHNTKHYMFVIPKSNKLKNSFDFLIDFLRLYSVLSNLYYLAFGNESSASIYLNHIIWGVFLLDFLLNFFTEYRTNKNISVFNLSVIAENYAKTWMIVDLIPLLPLSWFGYTNEEYLLSLFRIFKMNRILSHVDASLLSDYLSNLFYSHENRAKKVFKNAVEISWELIELIFIMLFGVICITFIWYFYVELIIRRENPKYNFFHEFNLKNNSESWNFLITLYFIFSTVTTVGYGDYNATNEYEMGFIIFLVIIAPAYFAYLTGKVVKGINDLTDIGDIKEKKTKLDLWLSSIKQNNNHLSLPLKQKINDHYNYYWKNNRLGSLSILSENTETVLDNPDHLFLNSLPISIKNQIIEYLFSDIYYSFKYFFQEFQNIKYNISLCLHPRIYYKDSVIQQINKKINEVLLVTKGSFKMRCIVDDSFKDVKTISKKCIIGDYFFFSGLPSFIEFKVEDTVHGFCIPCYALKKLTEPYKKNIMVYLKKLKPYYDHIISTIDDQEKLKTTENFNKIEFGSPNTKSELSYQELYTDPSSYSNMDTINCQISKIKSSLKSMKSKKKKLFKDLKLKLAKTISNDKY